MRYKYILFELLKMLDAKLCNSFEIKFSFYFFFFLFNFSFFVLIFSKKKDNDAQTEDISGRNKIIVVGDIISVNIRIDVDDFKDFLAMLN